MMDSTREELPDVNDYARSLSEVVAEYAGGNLTTIVCMTCGENFTRYLPGVNGITEWGRHQNVAVGISIWWWHLCFYELLQMLKGTSEANHGSKQSPGNDSSNDWKTVEVSGASDESSSLQESNWRKSCCRFANACDRILYWEKAWMLEFRNLGSFLYQKASIASDICIVFVKLVRLPSTSA